MTAAKMVSATQAPNGQAVSNAARSDGLSWDRELLALELPESSVALNFDVAVTGFETAEIDLLVGELNRDEPEEADNVPDIDRYALDRASYQVLLRSKKAQMAFIDPPYNVPIAGNVLGLGRIGHREFLMAAGEMTQVGFTEFLKTSFERLTAFSTNGSMHFICVDWRHLQEVLDGAKPYSELKNLCVWAKSNNGIPNHASDTFAVKAKSKKLGPMRGLDRFATG